MQPPYPSDAPPATIWRVGAADPTVFVVVRDDWVPKLSELPLKVDTVKENAGVRHRVETVDFLSSSG
jgi:hypothetical protein